jgi:DNA-directed RNA polymerase specialized sigma24 family protein
MTTHATTEEILDAFRALTSSEYEALAHAAATLMRSTRFTEPADLISETLNLLLDGRRNWPAKMDFGPFMYATMRSVADADRQLHSNKLAAAQSVEDVIDRPGGQQLRSPSVEEQLIEAEPSRLVRRAAQLASRQLAGDRDAQGVLESIFEGLSREETCESMSLAPAAYDNARKRVYRKIMKCMDAPLH